MCSLAMCDFSGDGNLEVKKVNITVPSYFIYHYNVFSLKGLYGGYVSFFVMKHNKKLLVNDKLTLCQTEYVDPNIISNVTNNKIELFYAKTFSKTTLVICFNLLQVFPSVSPFVLYTN